MQAAQGEVAAGLYCSCGERWAKWRVPRGSNDWGSSCCSYFTKCPLATIVLLTPLCFASTASVFLRNLPSCVAQLRMPHRKARCPHQQSTAAALPPPMHLYPLDSWVLATRNPCLAHIHNPHPTTRCRHQQATAAALPPPMLPVRPCPPGSCHAITHLQHPSSRQP